MGPTWPKQRASVLMMLTVAMSFLIAQAGPVEIQTDILIDFETVPYDFVLDEPSRRLYVSLPELHEIAIVSTRSYRVVDRIPVSAQPWGIDLSADGARLYVALRDSGTIAVIDPITFETLIVPVAVEVGNVEIFDVCEATPTQLLVSADPGSGGFAHIASFDPTNDFAGQRVGNGGTFRECPVFSVDQQKRFVYIGENFSPARVIQLDLTQEHIPIVQSTNDGVGGARRLEPSPDGSRLFVGGGSVLDTKTFQRVGTIGYGNPKFGVSPDRIFTVFGTNMIKVYDTSTFEEIERIPLNCGSSGRRLMVLPEDAGWLTLSTSTVLCGGLADIIDCNKNGVQDETDIAEGTSEDIDDNGVPDECERCELADVDGNALVDINDLLIVIAQWGVCPPLCIGDIDRDGVVDLADILALLSAWGPCGPEPSS